MDALDSISLEVSYALTQLRKYGDVLRAIAALEHIEVRIADAKEVDAGRWDGVPYRKGA